MRPHIDVATALLGTGLMMADVPAIAADVLVTRTSVSFETARNIAEAALARAASVNCPVAVVVVDDKAIPLIVLRQDRATEQHITGATRKAWTSVNLKASTYALLDDIKGGAGDESQLPYVENALFLMGGVPLYANDEIVGAIGVAGCPDGPGDDAIARAGAKAFDKSLAR